MKEKIKPEKTKKTDDVINGIKKYLLNKYVGFIVSFVFGLLVTTQIHTAAVNINHYFPGEHWLFPDGTDLSIEVERLTQTFYFTETNISFDIFTKNSWYESKTAKISISITGSNSNILCSINNESCFEYPILLPPKGENYVDLHPLLVIGEMSGKYNICCKVYNNEGHFDEKCKEIEILKIPSD